MKTIKDPSSNAEYKPLPRNGLAVKNKTAVMCAGDFRVHHGDLVLYDEGDITQIGRVFGVVTKHGAGDPPKELHLGVLTLSLNRQFAFTRHVPLQDVMASYGYKKTALLRWFIGETPTFEEFDLVLAIQKYGAMNNDQFLKFDLAGCGLIPPPNMEYYQSTVFNNRKLTHVCAQFEVFLTKACLIDKNGKLFTGGCLLYANLVGQYILQHAHFNAEDRLSLRNFAFALDEVASEYQKRIQGRLFDEQVLRGFNSPDKPKKK